VRKFEDRGYLVTVVFDGMSPPAKAGTSDGRRERREGFYRRARELQKREPRKSALINALASQACVFDNRVNARIAKHLRSLIRGEVYIAPGEADPQVVVFQNIYLAAGHNEVYVFGNDSDFLVLGVEQLLVEIRLDRGGALTGLCFKASLLFEPSASSLCLATEQHAWLRQLHGLPKEVEELGPNVLLQPLPGEVARQRLLLYAIVVGNDFAQFANVGPVTAAKTVFSLHYHSAVDGHTAECVPFEAFVGELA
ncbi:unnamed protein product, partial [Hapterophycus canaliculatus]